ncbi:hypothetical protein CHUAL_013078 [Chamberlinius hualienensis]
MTTIKLDILWSPQFPDKFVTFGTDLRQYTLTSAKLDSTSLHSSSDDGRVATLLAVNSDTLYLKCVCWCPREDYDNLLAVGQASGRVVLTSFNSQQDPCKLISKEFIPRHPRQCNALSWNSVDSNLLVAGLEKYRSDYSLLVWDVIKSTSYTGDSERRTLSGNYDTNVFPTRSVYEYGHSEAIHSVQWLLSQHKTLIVGCNQKYLKILDIRESTRQPTSTTTKAVYGLAIDPFNSNRIVSHYDSQIILWDIRNFDKPLVTLNDPGPILKVAFCPTRSNLLSSMNKDSAQIKLYDIQQIGGDEIEPTVVERRLPSQGNRPLLTYCWHPFYDNNLYEVNYSNEIHSRTVSERITLNWSATSVLAWSQSKKTVQCIDPANTGANYFDDISITMRQRVVDGYSFDPKKNSDVVKDDLQLHLVWKWLDLIKKLREEGKIHLPTGKAANLGVHSLVCGENLTGSTVIRSDCTSQMWSGLPSHHMSLKIYKCPERDQALLLCGWSVDRDGITTMLDRLEANDCYQRAAAIAVFNMKMLKAISILQKGAQKATQVSGGVPLAMIAMSLSGYTEDKTSLWRDMCDKLRSQLQDPYLRAMFAFLTSDNDSYEDVLNEEGVSIQDRAAFASIYLPDNKLAEHLSKVIHRLQESASLDGLLLTGMGDQGINLLQKYVDLTSDVQTASLIIMQVLPIVKKLEPRASVWIESYRLLLDQWRFWHQRALLDNIWNKCDAEWTPVHNVFISCSFCGKTISPLPLGQDKQKSNSRFGGATNRVKVRCCVGCRKPLPRCALCLMHMGSPAGTLATRSEKKTESRESKLGVFSEWFTWCQTCRHGGHANHIASWFKDHVECPVTACSCKCMTLDSLNRIEHASASPIKPKNV